MPPQDGVVVPVAGVQLVLTGQVFGQNACGLPGAKYGEPVVAISDQFGMAIAEGAIKARAPLVIVVGAIWTRVSLEGIHANGGRGVDATTVVRVVQRDSIDCDADGTERVEQIDRRIWSEHRIHGEHDGPVLVGRGIGVLARRIGA